MNWKREYDVAIRKLNILQRRADLQEQRIDTRDSALAAQSERIAVLEAMVIPKEPPLPVLTTSRHHGGGMHIVEVDGERVTKYGDHRRGGEWFTKEGAFEYLQVCKAEEAERQAEFLRVQPVNAPPA